MLGENDLISEFTEGLRAYGCTEHNDKQLRDSTRTLLKLFTDANGTWTAVNDPKGMGYETSKKGKLYDLLHKPWTVSPQSTASQNALRTLHPVLTARALTHMFTHTHTYIFHTVFDC